MRGYSSSPRSRAEGASSKLTSYLARTNKIAMTLNDVCFRRAAPLRCGSPPCADQLNTSGCRALRGNLLASAKTSMFVQLNRRHECVTLIETPLTDVPLVVVLPGRTIVSFAAVAIHSMLLVEFLGSIKSNFHQT